MIEYKTFENQLPDPVLEAVLALHFQVFDGQERAELVREINETPHLLTLIAYENNEAVGYKMGYRRKKRAFLQLARLRLAEPPRAGNCEPTHDITARLVSRQWLSYHPNDDLQQMAEHVDPEPKARF